MISKYLCISVVVVLQSVRPANAVESRIEVFERKRYTVSVVDVKRETLRLFLRDDSGKPLKRFARLRAWLDTKDQSLVWAVNAGMYHPDYSPVGLFILDGRPIAPLNLKAGVGNFFLKPNGVFGLADSGAFVVESSRVPHIREKILLATQSGPLLVQGGRLHPAFRAGSKNVLHRNGVGVPSGAIAVFAVSEDPVNFDEFARFFRDRMRCPDALFLDGTVCSLHDANVHRSDEKIDLGPMLAITKRK